MPTSRELIANHPLTGPELKKIILDDITAVLDNDGVYLPTVAYGRCSYEVRVTLHTDNFMFPQQQAVARSREPARDKLKARPELAAIEADLPLDDPSHLSFISAQERHRDIESPNAARIDHGLPVNVVRRENDGHWQEEQVTYDKSLVPEGSSPEPTDRDLSDQVRRDLGLHGTNRVRAEVVPTPTDADACACEHPKADAGGTCGVCGGFVVEELGA
jgi:hypothetical protein